MWRLLLVLMWRCASSAGPDSWRCPEIDAQPTVECTCDMPHTLRCTGDKTALAIIGETLREKASHSISLLDCTVQNVTSITEPILDGVALHGLVISSGALRRIDKKAFEKLAAPLQALGLPNNKLDDVPTIALQSLPELDRLDLSGNQLVHLDMSSFEGLRNLSFIDVSNNQISTVTPDAFDDLPQLRNLRLRANRLTMQTVAKLNPLPTVEQLDLSENSLIGPLGPITFAAMDRLDDLQLSHNTLSSIKMGCLRGLTALTSLRLQHNQIDVIEDHAFSQLTGLRTLELAHNRIVAVSGASLAHLQKLTFLDLRHNFLRAVTADLVQPLKCLKTLKLDENDISIVASDAFKPSTELEHLTLSENPLNCDCSLSDFAEWLTNSTLDKADKSTAVCTTPPHLENGLLADMPGYTLICGDDDDTVSAPLSSPFKAKINLKEFEYDGEEIRFTWSVEDDFTSYTCDAVFIYEEEGPNEVLVESHPVKCNSSEQEDPKVLRVAVPEVRQLRGDGSYRYCIVLLEAVQADDVSLILGCSDILPLVRVDRVKVQKVVGGLPKVLNVMANLSESGVLSVGVKVFPGVDCEVNVGVFERGAVLAQRTINCLDPTYSFFGLHSDGPYRVCANVVSSSPSINKSKCAAVFKPISGGGFTGLDLAVILVFVVLLFVVIVLVWGMKKILMKSKMQTHRCYLPPECDEHVQHNRYVKLQATTKL